MQNQLLFLILFILIAGILSYIAILVLRSQRGAATRRQIIMIVGGATLLTLLKVNTIMSVAGLHTTEVVIHNGDIHRSLTVELNGSRGSIGPNEVGRYRTSRFHNRLRFTGSRGEVKKDFGRGYYVVHSGENYLLEVEELRYRAFKDRGKEKDTSPVFIEIIDNQLVKLDDQYKNCIVLSPNQGTPYLASREMLQKRVFSTRRFRR